MDISDYGVRFDDPTGGFVLCRFGIIRSEGDTWQESFWPNGY